MKIQEKYSIEKIAKVFKDIRRKVPKIKRRNPSNPPRDSDSFEKVFKGVLDKKK